jgi:Mg/Co/Ni transporter MgtE
MTKGQITRFVAESSAQRLRAILDEMQLLKAHAPIHHLPADEQRFLLDLRDHEAHFRMLADAKLAGT